MPHDLWKKQAFLRTMDGKVVRHGANEEVIYELGARFNVREIVFERWGAVHMSQRLEEAGLTVVPFGQNFKDMSPPSKEFMKLALENRLRRSPGALVDG